MTAPYIASWNDTVWADVGGSANTTVKALHTYSGNLIAAGGFSVIGGVTASHIAKWNGTIWSALGSGTTDATITALASDSVFLYAGGGFTSIGGITANFIARWDGTSWFPFGAGFDNAVYALTVYNGELYAGGAFSTTASHIAKWNGSTWSAVGGGVNDNVYTLEVYNGELYAGGFFTAAGGASALQIAKWDGTSWSAVGSGTNADVNTMKKIGNDLYVGGNFTMAGGLYSPFIAKWDGAVWSDAGSVAANQFDLSVDAFATYNSHVFAAGRFSTFGSDTSANHIARSSFTVGLDDKINKDKRVIVYPNPFANNITVIFEKQSLNTGGKKVSVEIRNIFGQIVFSKSDENSTGNYLKTLDVGFLKTGIYLMEIIINDERIVKKIVRE